MRETDLLNYVYQQNQRLPKGVVVPPGDDMGAVKIGQATVLVTVDQVADGVHVDLATTPLELVGRKAMTRNLSDVAAMAALPVGAVVAVCLPKTLGEAKATQLFDAMRAVGEQYKCPLIGGDISMWDGKLLLSVTVIAETAGVQPVLRSGAAPGDVICVTGQVGGSWTSGGGVAAEAPHLTFEPRIDLARRIAQTHGVRLHSMIDLSDGLASDLPRICKASGVAAELDVAAIPLRPQAYAAAGRSGHPAWQHGLIDGEDYELCFTLSPAAADKLPGAIDDVPITRIGRILEIGDGPEKKDGGVWLRLADGQRISLARGGWEHTS